MEYSGPVYTPPSEHEQHSDNERNGHRTRKSPYVRQRQSAAPQQPTEKSRKEFYADEHPEIPRVRRASLKQFKTDVSPVVDQEEDAIYEESSTTAHLRLPWYRASPPPRTDPTVANKHEHGATASHTRISKKRAQKTMPPLTGLENEDEVRAWKQETGYHSRLPKRQPNETELDGNDEDRDDTATWEKLAQPTDRRSLHTEGIRPVRIPRRRPGTGKGPLTEHTGRLFHPGWPFLERKQRWMLLGLVALLLLILTPLIFNRNGKFAPNNGLNIFSQGYTVPGIPGVASNPHELVVTPPNTDHPAPPVLATSSYLLDTDNASTLYAQNPFLHLPMLSTTKLMTAALAMEKGNLDQQITVTPEMQQEIDQLSTDSALFGLKQGETYTLRDLLYGLLYVSGNDAALAIATAVSGNVADFVAQMNEKAQSLGMLDTHFVNPHGLLDDGQFSCAHDLAILGRYSLSIPMLQQISSGKTYHIAASGHHDARVILNENQFLWWYPGVTGGKTGFDGVSDFVQVMAVTRNHHHMIGVVMHSNDWWTDMRNLMNYGSTNYTWVSPHDVDASGQPIPYDNLWNYFANDTQQNTIPTSNQGRYYIYSGYSVSGPIMSYFDQQGGLKTFGFPTKMPVPSGDALLTQQFQHGSIQCDFSGQQCRQI